jgi:hypothetical protein
MTVPTCKHTYTYTNFYKMQAYFVKRLRGTGEAFKSYDCACTCIKAHTCTPHSRAYADFVKRLQVAEVEAERQRRQRWETALNSWRTLRSLHAMDLFNQRIRWVRHVVDYWLCSRPA